LNDFASPWDSTAEELTASPRPYPQADFKLLRGDEGGNRRKMGTRKTKERAGREKKVEWREIDLTLIRS